MTGIYDITKGTCDAGAMLKGEFFPCELSADHDGWDHQSITGELIWCEDRKRIDGKED